MDIISPHNVKLKLVRQLQQSRAARQEARAFVLEGARAIASAGDYPGRLQWVLYTALAAQRYPTVLTQLAAAAVPCYLTSLELFASCSETEHSQGILAVANMPAWVLPTACRAVLVCDQLNDPGNLGTLLRTAIAADWQCLCLMPGTVDVYNPKVVRASLGAVLQIPTFSLDWVQLRDWLEETPVWLADAAGVLPYYRVGWQQPTALIVSSEAHGASPAARQLATGSVKIPLVGGQESLNVAVAAGVLLFEAARQWQAAVSDRLIGCP